MTYPFPDRYPFHDREDDDGPNEPPSAQTGDTVKTWPPAMVLHPLDMDKFTRACADVNFAYDDWLSVTDVDPNESAVARESIRVTLQDIRDKALALIKMLESPPLR